MSVCRGLVAGSSVIFAGVILQLHNVTLNLAASFIMLSGMFVLLLTFGEKPGFKQTNAEEDTSKTSDEGDN